MIILSTSTEVLQIVTASARSTDYTVSWADHTSTTFLPDSSLGNISAATTTTVCAAPDDGVQRQIKLVSIRNRDGAASNVITVAKYDGASTIYLTPSVTLLAGETLNYIDSHGWYKLDANGSAAAAITPAPLTRVDDTNVTLTLGGTPATALLQSVSLTLGWTGVLSTARGGTAVNIASAALVLGTASTTAGQLTLSNATNAFTQTIRGTNPAASITYDMPTTAPTLGQVLSATAPAAGIVTMSWATVTSTPGGSNTQLQYNNAGAFGGITGATSDGTNIFIPTLYGSSAANGDITIEGTSNGTKTTSYILLQPTGGFVGIATAAPTAYIQTPSGLTNVAARFGTMEHQGNLNNCFIADNMYYSGGFLYRQNGYVSSVYFSSGDVIIYTAPSGSAGAAAGISDRFTFTNVGKFGIGVSSASITALAHIKAGTATANTAPIQINVGTSETTARSGLVQFSSSSASGIQAVSGSRFTVTESDTTERYVVQAATSAKVTAAAPYANDGYVLMTINGTTIKVMTTA